MLALQGIKNVSMSPNSSQLADNIYNFQEVHGDCYCYNNAP
jgi:hypothetical protein